MMTKQLEQEQNQGRERMQEIMEKLSLGDNMCKGMWLFIDEIKQYAAITELDEVITYGLIHKIVASEKQVVYSEKIQRVGNVYNFVDDILN